MSVSSIMKLMIAAFLIAASVSAKAQNYWVVETEKTGNSVVKIYDSGDKLVSTSQFQRRIDINRKRERKMLNKMVKQQSPLLWSKR